MGKTMNKITKILTGTALAMALATGGALAAGGETKPAKDIDFSFEGMFGKFDRGQLQRGFLVYKEVCAACHSLRLVSFRNLSQPGGPGFSEDQVKAIAAGYEVTDGPNAEGEMFQRPGIPADRIPSPFPNAEAAKAANGGAYPPDLSLVTKSREGWHFPWYVSPFIKLVKGGGGPEYVYSLVSGYGEAPHGEEQEGLHYNPYFPNGWLAMAAPLNEDAVEYGDGTKATVDQMARDVTAFLAWASEPKMEERKRIGFMVMIYLGVLSVLMYLVKKAIWRDQH
jgi:cytochrome c1